MISPSRSIKTTMSLGFSPSFSLTILGSVTWFFVERVEVARILSFIVNTYVKIVGNVYKSCLTYNTWKVKK